MASTEQLIGTLSADLAPVKPLRGGDALVALWWLLGIGAVAFAMTLMAPWRSTALAQLLSAPRFALEVTSGMLASGFVALYAFRLALPGRSRKGLFVCAVAVAMVWLSVVISSLFWPPLEPSTQGARHGCYLHTVVLAVPPAILACWLASRRYLLRPVYTFACLGLVAGMIPAVLMQLGCMYGPVHGLMFHILPGVLLMPLAAVVAMGVSTARRRSLAR